MNSFYEHLSYITAIFDSWTPCERTVVLCALFRRVPWYNMNLLKNTLDISLSRQVSEQSEIIETRANNVEIITETTKTTDENDQTLPMDDIGEKLMKLLVYLPLLNQSNERVKELYLNSVPDFIQLCVDNNVYMNECKQYLSYMLIHPALDSNDRGSLGHWLRYLENHLAALNDRDQNGYDTSPSNYGSTCSVSIGYSGSNGSLSNGAQGSNSNLSERTDGSTGNLSNGNSNLATLLENGQNGSFRRTIGKNLEPKDEGGSGECLQESFTKNGKELDVSNEGENVEPLIPKPRSNSLTPPMPSHMSSSAESLNTDEYFVQKPRSFSLSSEHMAQLRPLLMTTGSETRLDMLKANKFCEHPGMSTVAPWLKGLRLHKYVWLFSNISYEQMMAMDDEYLTKLGVTTGARHKLLLCISKLHGRPALLESMAQDLRAGAPPPPTIATMLDQLRSVLVSPILPASGLCTQLVEVLQLASTRLLSGAPTSPPLPAFPAYNHQAEEQSYEHPVAGYDPVSMHCWLLDRALHHPSFTCCPELVDRLKQLRYRLPPRQFFSHLSDLPFTKRGGAKTRWRAQVVPKQPPPNRQGAFLTIPSNYGGPSSKQGTTSASYPCFPPLPGHKSADGSPRLPHRASVSLQDINHRLESLCLQMTENLTE